MTYIASRHGEGLSTKLITARIQIHHIDFADKYNFAMGKFINSALWTLVHDLQADYDCEIDKFRLTHSRQENRCYVVDARGSKTISVRLRMDCYEYLKINAYCVNAAINLALDRYRRYLKAGRVAQFVINAITKNGFVPYKLNEIEQQNER